MSNILFGHKGEVVGSFGPIMAALPIKKESEMDLTQIDFDDLKKKIKEEIPNQIREAKKLLNFDKLDNSYLIISSIIKILKCDIFDAYFIKGIFTEMGVDFAIHDSWFRVSSFIPSTPADPIEVF